MSATADDVAVRVARDLGSIAILMDSERRKATGAGQHEAAESLAVQANLFAEGERIIRSQAERIEKLEEALQSIRRLVGDDDNEQHEWTAQDMVEALQDADQTARAALERT